MSTAEAGATTTAPAAAPAVEAAPAPEAAAAATLPAPEVTTAVAPASPTMKTGNESLAGSIINAVQLRSLESRISSDHLKELTDNAKLMEGGATQSSDKQWFSAPITVEEAHKSSVKCIACQAGGFLAVKLGNHVYKLDVLSSFTSVIIATVVLFVAYLALGSAMTPGGYIFAPLLTIFIGSVFGQLISVITKVPPLVGMLVAGMIWGNLPLGLSQGISDTTYKFLRNIAVAVILSRAGLTFKWSLTKPVLLNVILQSVVPQSFEVITHSLLAYWLFGSVYPTFAFALYQGAAVACSSTAVVIPGVSMMQERGFSVTRGPGILMLCSIAFDAVFAIWFSSFVFELVFPDEADGLPLSYKIALAPVQIIVGAIAGLLLGIMCHALYNQFFTRVIEASEAHKETAEKEVRAKCLTLTTAIGVGLVFGTYKIGFPGAGTVAVVCVSGALAFLWGRHPETDDRRRKLYADTADLWDSFVMPCLFTVVGASINLSIVLNMQLLPNILICIFGGLFVKMIGCVIVSSGAGYSFKEKIFLAVGWCAKSTVQAATAGKVLAYVNDLNSSNWAGNDPAKQAFLQQAAIAGALTNTIVVCSILFCAIGAGVGMKITGPCCLVKEEGAAGGGGGH